MSAYEPPDRPRRGAHLERNERREPTLFGEETYFDVKRSPVIFSIPSSVAENNTSDDSDPPEALLKEAQTLLRARERDMGVFMIACMNALVADPDGFPEQLVGHWPTIRPAGRRPRHITLLKNLGAQGMPHLAAMHMRYAATAP